MWSKKMPQDSDELLEGFHGGFYYRLNSVHIEVYINKGIGSVLATCYVGARMEVEKVHALARGFIDINAKPLTRKSMKQNEE